MPRILTYNVHSGVGTDGVLDIARTAEVIARCKADIVALQELDVGRERTRGMDQAHELAERLGMRFAFHAALKVEEEQYGDAILTHLPMRLVRSAPLPTLPEFTVLETRGALWVEVDVGGRRLQVINTHLGLVPREQREQVAALLGEDWISHSACVDPVILLGDFNAVSRARPYRALTGALRDAQKTLRRRTHKTFPSRAPLLRIDHLFVSKSVIVQDVQAADAPLMRVASDHLPLWMDFELAGG